MDNARIHHYKVLKSYIDTINNINFLYNVAYSPETNPIEKVFSKTKNYMRNQIIDNNNLLLKIEEAFKTITQTDLIKFYLKSFI